MSPELEPTDGENAPSRDLPAPYVSPWSELGRTLSALVADIQLRARELWRRNGEGSLGVPSFWPLDLAPVFWPLVVALTTAASLLLGGFGLHQFHRPSSPSTVASDVDPAVVDTPPVFEPQPDPSPLEQRSVPAEASEPPLHDDEAPIAVEPVQQPGPMEPEIVEPDPLLDLLMDPRDPVELLLATAPNPSDDSIQLRLANARWRLISTDSKQRLALQWQERLRELGYERLTLIDEQEHPLGRSALVGTGMILVNAEDELQR